MMTLSKQAVAAGLTVISVLFFWAASITAFQFVDKGAVPEQWEVFFPVALAGLMFAAGCMILAVVLKLFNQ